MPCGDGLANVTSDVDTQRSDTTEWRPACVSPVGTHVKVWVYFVYDDGKCDINTESIWPTTKWPPSPWAVAWKPCQFVTITRRDLELVEQERDRVQQSAQERHDAHLSSVRKRVLEQLTDDEREALGLSRRK